MKSLLPKFVPVANGAKCKVTFDVTDVTLCKHSETFVPFSCLTVSKWSEIIKKNKIKKATPLKVLGNAGKQNLAACHAFHAM